MSNKEEQRALNCPKHGDVWTERHTNYTYVCDVSDGLVKAIFLWGGGREAHLLSIDDFQEFLMYSTAPINGIKDWCWAMFIKNDPDNGDWMKTWYKEVKENGIKDV